MVAPPPTRYNSITIVTNTVEYTWIICSCSQKHPD